VSKKINIDRFKAYCGAETKAIAESLAHLKEKHEYIIFKDISWQSTG